MTITRDPTMRDRAQAINAMSHEWAMTSHPDGTITWVDGRAARAFGAREGMSIGSLVASLNEVKVSHFLDAAGSGRTDNWELIFRTGTDADRPLLFSVSGAPLHESILIVGSPLPHEYIAVQEQLSATLNELAVAHRGVVQRELALAAAHRELVENSAVLDRLNRVLAKTARIDPLTGLGNRLHLGETLDALHERAAQDGHGYSVAFCDVDHFKTYNDQYGQPAGDRVPHSIAETLMSCVRQADAVYRYGGEELLILFPNEAGTGALRATERACHAVRPLGIPHDGNQGGGVTLSAGIASFLPGSDLHSDGVLERADAALYRAKAAGRDRVVVEEDDGDAQQ